jgi:hypothetical protein
VPSHEYHKLTVDGYRQVAQLLQRALPADQSYAPAAAASSVGTSTTFTNRPHVLAADDSETSARAAQSGQDGVVGWGEQGVVRQHGEAINSFSSISRVSNLTLEQVHFVRGSAVD